VVVPDDWSPSRSGPVVVGLAEVGAGPVLEQALVEAQRRGVAVRAVHAWDIHPELTWDAELAYGDLHELEGDVHNRLMEVATPWTDKFPDLAFELEVRRAHPATALREASAGAVLMVVGAHPTRFRPSNGHQRLGSVARAVLHHATVPVMVFRGS
jgi:nucleotide-binding universal stress UspA family protein